MQNKKIYSLLLIVLIVLAGLGLKAILNHGATGSSQEVIQTEESSVCKFQPKSAPYFTPKVHHYL